MRFLTRSTSPAITANAARATVRARGDSTVDGETAETRSADSVAAAQTSPLPALPSLAWYSLVTPVAEPSARSTAVPSAPIASSPHPPSIVATGPSEPVPEPVVASHGAAGADGT